MIYEQYAMYNPYYLNNIMLLKKFIIILCFIPIALFGQNSNLVSETENISLKFSNLSFEQLYDTANYYREMNIKDTAILCYHLLMNMPMKLRDEAYWEIMANSLKNQGVIYQQLGDFQTAYQLYIRALKLAEKYNFLEIQQKIYNNIGVVFSRFKEFQLAQYYYFKSLDINTDNETYRATLNNLGNVVENYDSALYYFKQAIQSETKVNVCALANIASIYLNKEQYDSAYHYFRLSMAEFNKSNNLNCYQQALSAFAEYFVATNQFDSAKYYLELSNTIAVEHNFMHTQTTNLKLLSQIEKSQGHIKKSLEYLEQYIHLNDSILSTTKLGNINQLQRLYEMEKTDEQITELTLEQQVKARTILYQKIILIFAVVVLFLLGFGFIYIYLQKRELGKAYKVLFEKNIEIVSLQDNSTQTNLSKNKTQIDDNDKLLKRILNIFEDNNTICNEKFTIDTLAELVESNRTYVSQIINQKLHKNFCSLLNSYRIREIQRMLSEPDSLKLTLDYIALQAGFSSYPAFWKAFKECTGVTPTFYIQSLKSE